MTRIVDELVEHALRELADESSQRQLWLATTGPTVSSFTECISRLLDDSGLAMALDAGELVYDNLIDAELRALSEVIRGIDDVRDPRVILDDPELNRVRVIAADLLKRLRWFGSHDST
jgi:hypothetical protein